MRFDARLPTGSDERAQALTRIGDNRQRSELVRMGAADIDADKLHIWVLPSRIRASGEIGQAGADEKDEIGIGGVFARKRRASMTASTDQERRFFLERAPARMRFADRNAEPVREFATVPPKL